MAPLIKAAATSCALFAAGDFISQALVEKVTPYDARRTARFATVGALLHGPYFRLCFDRLDKTFPAKTVTSVLAKSATAQLLVFPPYLCGFFIASALLEGKSFQSGVERVKTSIWKTFVAGSLVWPVTNAANFMFLPPSCRVLGLNVVGIGWNTYLSLVNKRAELQVEEEKLEHRRVAAE